MTGALIIYSATFMRYSMAVTPRNYLLFACHFINEGAQLTQGYRYLHYWKCVCLHLFSPNRAFADKNIVCYFSWGGREKQLEEQAAAEAQNAGKPVVEKGKEGTEQVKK
jgi:hypothetical protein